MLDSCTLSARGRLVWLALSGALVLGGGLLEAQDPRGASAVAVSFPEPPVPSEILSRPARLDVENVSLRTALDALEHRSGVAIAYSSRLLPLGRLVTCRCENATVEDAFGELLRGTWLEAYVIAGQVVVRERASRTPPDAPVLAQAGLTAAFAASRIAPSGLLNPQARRVATAPAPVRRQGTITGEVVDAGTGVVLSAVQVHISALQLGVLTGADGTYTLANVPAGEHTVRAQLLGYRPVDERVTVASGVVMELNFRLARDVLGLDQIIVTGTPGGTQVRAIGNVVGRVRAAEITQIAPVTSMQDLLGAREPGLSFHRQSGNIGTGSQMRIRGISSITMGNQPLIYVDGIRVDNEGAGGPNIRDGRQASTLDDLSPEEIESIEIIKGPAAATLYGTEASAGVIQIITKRGQSGAPQFDLAIRQGGTWLPDLSRMIGDSYARAPDGTISSFNIYEAEKAAGRNHFQTGHLQSYTASVRGGTEQVRYYLSADLDNNEGIVNYNWQKQTNLRANVTILPFETLTLDVNTGYIVGETSFMQQLTAWGMWEQFQWATPAGRDGLLRGFLRARPEEIANVEAKREVNRFIGSATLTHVPTPWLTQRLILGTDRVNEENYILFPRHPEGTLHDFGGLSLGDLQLERPNRQYATLDYSASARYALNPDLRFTSSLGFQYYSRTEKEVVGLGRIFPAPQIRTLSGAAASTAFQTFVENKSVGMYVQQEVNLHDRIFLTAAVRGDDNSAFGTEYDAAIYPKLSGTWVISEEGFWLDRRLDRYANSLRLRSAWGRAGRQPDTFAAVTLFAPEPGAGGQPSVSPDVLGNPDLGPEVSSEIELGFDVSLLNDRAMAEFTYYSQTVKDALVSVPIPSTAGFPGTQSVNLGQISNHGWELSVRGDVYRTPRLTWNLGTGITSNENRVDDLGGRPPTSALREGRPYPFQVERIILTAEFDANGNVVNLTCDMGGGGADGLNPTGTPGPCSGAGAAPLLRLGNGLAIPKYEANFNSTLTLFENLRLFAMVEWRGEHWRSLTDASCRHTCFQTSRAAVERPLEYIFAVAQIDGRVTGTRHIATFDASFAKLRELSANYTLPTSVAGRIGASRASINVAGRNLWPIWVAQKDISGAPVTDPEARNSTSITGSNSNVPPLASFVVTMRVSF